MRMRFAIALLLLLAALASSGLIWRSIFADPLLVIAIVALSSALGIAAALLVERAAPTKALPTVLGIAAALTLAVAVLGRFQGLATTGLLIGFEVGFIAVPAGVSLITSMIAAALLRHRQHAVLAIIPIVAAHGVALAYTLSSSGSPTLVLAIGAIAGVGSVALRTASTDRTGLGLLAPLPILAVALGSGLGIAALVDGDAGFDLRDRLNPPIELVEASSPLSIVKSGLVQESPEPVFDISVEGLVGDATIDRVAVAYLDTYDGTVWAADSSYIAAGSTLPQISQTSATSGPPLTQQVSLTSAYPFEQLPSIGLVTRIESGDLYWDSVSGGILSIEGDRSTLSYRTEALLVDRERRPDSAADPSPPLAVRPALGFPEEYKTAQVRDPLNGFVAAVGLSQDTTEVEQLVEIEAALRSAQFGYNPSAAGGHSLAALAQYLGSYQSGETSTGFAEHSAASFAVLARALDLPSRVVVGYRFADPLSATNTEATVDEGQVHAWPEVWLAGQGWVAFEPTNPDNVTTATENQPPSVTEGSTDQGEAASTAPFELPELLDPEVDDKAASRDIPWRWILLAALIPLYLILVPLAKALRRQRRRTVGGPDDRVMGAWREAQDRLRDGGELVPTSGRVIDLRDSIDLTEAEGSLLTLAHDVDVALYSPDDTPDDYVVDAWTSAQAVVNDASGQWSLVRKAKAAADPRSLFRR